MSRSIQLDESWLEYLGSEFDKPYMTDLRQFLLREKQAGKTIYPKGPDIFAALNLTPLQSVKVVIIGQDPYHGPGQAHGLCFSVLPGIPAPPSLKNIFQEIRNDKDVNIPEYTAGKGNLIPWARQGVLLLNSVLTVEHKKAGSHQGRGWETFTDRIVETLNASREGVVYLLWGSYAQRKGSIVNGQQNLVLSSPHPSPLSAYRGFFGCRHFSRANTYLVQRGQPEIDWSLVD